MFQLGNKNGILNGWFSKADFNIIKQNFLDIRDVNQGKTISLRQAAIMNSVVGGQGMKKCNCKTKCDTKRCTCKKNGYHCNSKCKCLSSGCINKE